MEITRRVFLGALAFCFFGFTGLSAIAAQPKVRQPDSAVQTAYEYDYPATEAAPLPGNLAVTSVPAATAAEAASSEQAAPEPYKEPFNDPAFYSKSDVEPSKPWQLPQPCALQNRGIKMGGWLQQGIAYNARNPQDRYNGPLLCNDRSGDYQLNQAWLYFDKPVDNQGCGWDIGYRFDMVYGSDWRAANTLGIENNINGPNQFYGLALPQFYADVAYNDLTVRVGHWAPSMGYEIVPAVGNFFYSHSYGMCYGQPLLITGAEADYKLTDQVSLSGGIHRGQNEFEDPADTWNFIGGAEWTSQSKRTTLKITADTGKADFLPDGNQQFFYALVGTQKITDRWSYAFEHDYGVWKDFSPNGDASWYNLAQYLFYTINTKWSAGMRIEWYRDNDGARVAGLGTVPNMRGWVGGPGFEGDFTELTLGVNWKPHANAMIRPEIRWDWYNGSRDVNDRLPFADGNRSDQFTFATDLILTY